MLTLLVRCITTAWLLLGLVSCQRISKEPRIIGQPATSGEGAATAVAPPLRLLTAEGKRLTLRPWQGKYVVVVFWASDNEASREQSPGLRKINEQFQSRGLEIYGVSLDRDKHRWQEAVQTDGLVWPQVLARRGWPGRSTVAYGVPALPYSVLIDPQGHILARNLWGRALGQKIAEYIPLD